MLETRDLENISKVLQEYSVTLDLYGETENFELLYFKALYFLHILSIQRRINLCKQVRDRLILPIAKYF